MSTPSIRAVGLSKSYRSNAGLNGWLEALRDVSFEVAVGESVGLIGPNGAGKSTLLRILSRVTRPSAGYADVQGRVGALLEVGTGFHPELTGRENTYLSGALLGMSRADVRARFDQIVDFAEVAAFVDTPVKHYSSGMYARLGFAVAAHLLPNILMVDEVLAVGDVPFQAKCLARMHALTEEGTTVLFVSHNLLAVADLCRRVITMRQGRVAFDGPSGEGIHEFRRSLAGSARQPHSSADSFISMALNGDPVYDGQEHVLSGPIELEVSIPRAESVERRQVYLNVVIRSADDRVLIHLRSDLAGHTLSIEPGGSVLGVQMDQLPLAPGTYGLSARVADLGKVDPFIWDSPQIALVVLGDSRTDALVLPTHHFTQRTFARPLEAAIP